MIAIAAEKMFFMRTKQTTPLPAPLTFWGLLVISARPTVLMTPTLFKHVGVVGAKMTVLAARRQTVGPPAILHRSAEGHSGAALHRAALDKDGAGAETEASLGVWKKHVGSGLMKRAVQRGLPAGNFERTTQKRGVMGCPPSGRRREASTVLRRLGWRAEIVAS